MRPNVRRLFPRFNHHHGIGRCVEIIERGRIVVKLIAEDDDQAATVTHAGGFALGAEDLLARQRSEQYFTSSQFFAQALRHAISRPQAMHNLDGSEDLLPLKLTATPR